MEETKEVRWQIPETLNRFLKIGAAIDGISVNEFAVKHLSKIKLPPYKEVKDA
jgi:hypothetical protein